MEYLELSKKYATNPVARAIVSCLPHVGGGMDVILTNKWNQYQQKRIERLISTLSESLDKVQSTSIDREFLESEAFFDILLNAMPIVLKTRIPEIQDAIANMIKEVVLEPEKTNTIESLIQDLSGFTKKDFIVFMELSKIYKTNKTFMPVQLISETYNIFVGLDDAVRYMNRFAYLLLLDYPRNTLYGPGKIPYSPTPLFRQLEVNIGL